MAEDTVRGIFDNKAYQGLTNHVRTSVRELLTFKTTDVPELVKIFGGKNIPSGGVTDEQAKELIKFYTKGRYPGIGNEVITVMSNDLKTQSPTLFKKATKVAEKDPLKITLAEAAELYNKEIGTSTITSFGDKGKFKKYKNVALVDAFKGDKGSRIIDEILGQTDTPGTFNTMIDNLRLISKPVRRRISLSNPNDPSLNIIPGLEAKDEQTKIVFGERKVAGGAAEVAILTDNRQGWKEFFDKIDAIADDPNNPKQALANAFRVSYYTGPRPGLIAGLQGSEYLIDQGAIYVTPQTKTVGAEKDQETRKGASKGKTSFKKKATPYTVPLGENAHAYLQQQLKINANDPDIKAYLAEQKKLGKAPIFVQKTIGKDGKVKVSAIGTPAISSMLSDITTSTPIIIDNQSGKEYNSLNPVEKTETGKFGSALSRNIHASVGLNELNEADQLIDFLHGRSETSGTKGRGQTKKQKYALRARGRFTQGERDGQQRIGNWINGVQGKDATTIPDIQNKVSKANYALEGFFDQPVDTTPVTLNTPDNKSKLISDIISGKVSMAEAMAEAKNKVKTRLSKPIDGGTKTNMALVGGFSAGMALASGDAEAGANVGTQMVGEELLEKGTIEVLKKAGLAARTANPVGVGLTIAASTVSTIGDQSFEKEMRLAKQLGVDRNTIINLPPEEKEKLFGLLERTQVNELAQEQKKISLGEQMRNLSMNKPNVTDSFMNSDISDNQI